MANQADPVIDAVQDRHVEKIILSGSPFVSSIFGPGAYQITAASVPAFYTDPVISGSVVVEQILTCDAEAHRSSPRATLAYQWKKDTVNITDATNKTYTTVLGDIDAEITCEAVATNASGFDTEISNGLTIQAITDTYIYELDVNAISGLSSPPRFDMVDADIQIISGMPHLMQGTIMECSMFAVTGMAVEGQITLASLEVYAVVLNPPA